MYCCKKVDFLIYSLYSYSLKVLSIQLARAYARVYVRVDVRMGGCVMRFPYSNEYIHHPFAILRLSNRTKTSQMISLSPKRFKAVKREIFDF